MNTAERDSQLRANLENLAVMPPQTLLIEGGTEQGRLDMALFWAKTANCPSALANKTPGPASPCLNCAVCQQIQANEYLDLIVYDGRIPNRQDEEKPAPVRALRMENVRDLKSLTATAPHGTGKRVAIFQGMSQTREEAMNSLLKTLEEPTPHTLFVLLAPQRQQLLPTLVSRSFCVALPWNDCFTLEPDLADWELSLAQFLINGSDFLERISVKGAVDATLGARIFLACQRAIVRVLGGHNTGALDRALAPLAANQKKAAIASRWLNDAQELLIAAVTPARALEAFATRLFVLLKQEQ